MAPSSPGALGDAVSSKPVALDESQPPIHVEMDTSDSEEGSSSWEALRETLMPSVGRDGQSVLPTTPNGLLLPKYALLINGDALNGWVKQNSPSCAAAVVAGAWNALGCGGRGVVGHSISTKDVLKDMDCMTQRVVDAKRSRFTRVLGVTETSFNEFELALDRAIAKHPTNPSLGGTGKSDPGISRKEVMKLVDQIANEFGTEELELTSELQKSSTSAYQQSESPGMVSSGVTGRRSAFAAIARLIADDKVRGDGADDESTKHENSISTDDDEDEPGTDCERVVSGATVTTEENDKPLCIAKSTTTKPKTVKTKPKKPPFFSPRLGPPSAAFRGAVGGGATGFTQGGGSIPGEGDPAGEPVAEQSVMRFQHQTKNKNAVWRWRFEFWQLVKKRAGLEKLRREKPSTAAFGNGGVIASFLRIAQGKNEASNTDDSVGCVSQTKYAYGARVAVGLKTATRKSLDVAVSKKDLESVTRLEKEKTLAKEWEGLRTLFAKNDTFLISHHRNHYASIYALRESVEVCESVCETSGLDDGARKEKTERKQIKREVLTARKGQRPAAWMDWLELRNTYLGWSGYGVIACERREIG